jgi:predicted nucleic acid-binding protein
VEAWIQSPGLVLLAESDTHWTELKAMIRTGKVVGPKVHDARVAALCLQHGVRELWSADRDFGRFPSLTTVNPMPGR